MEHEEWKHRFHLIFNVFVQIENNYKVNELKRTKLRTWNVWFHSMVIATRNLCHSFILCALSRFPGNFSECVLSWESENVQVEKQHAGEEKKTKWKKIFFVHSSFWAGFTLVFSCNAHLCNHCQRANTFYHDLQNIQNALRICPLCTNWRFFPPHSGKEISNILIKWGFSDVSCFFFRVAAAAACAVVVATTANQTNAPF